jgi:AcrR family transcriptional regulator
MDIMAGMELASLVAYALEGASETDDADLDATATRILDATLQEVAAQGMRSLTAEGVARRANVGRVTVYRRFGGREDLLAAMAVREGARMAEIVERAARAADTPADQFVAGFSAAVRAAREHPIIARAAVHEPGELLAAGIAHDAALMRLGADFVAASIGQLQDAGLAQHVEAAEAGETLARLFAALVLIPTNYAIDLSTDEATQGYVRRTLGPMVLGTH